MRLPTINAVWIGKTIGRVHAACLRSFLNTGHTVLLHTYGTVDGVPRGVRIRDANALLPEERLLRYSNGSFALSANIIRYQMMRRGLGLYVDCDVYCLRPIEDADVLVGWQDDEYINGAVLKLPTDHPATSGLASIAEGWIPPWRAHEPPIPLGSYPWGTTGPIAITHFLSTHHLVDRVMPRELFYPLHYTQWNLLLEPEIRIEDLASPQTHYIHLWNEFSKNAPLVDGSPLAEMVRTAEMPPMGRWLRRALLPRAAP